FHEGQFAAAAIPHGTWESVQIIMDVSPGAADGCGPQMSQCCKPRCRAVNTFVCHSLGKREQGTPCSAYWKMYRFPGIGIIGVESWQKTRKNRGQSESSPRCLNAVNPAVALSAPKYYLPEKT